MKLKILTGLIGVLLLSTTASATTLDGVCEIRFFGQSTLHDFVGKVTCQPFSLSDEGPRDTDGRLQAPRVKVLVREMDTDNTRRDKTMRAMFEEDKYPEIQSQLADLDLAALLQQLQEREEVPETLEFDLQIRQIKQRVKATTRERRVTPEQISFILDFPLSLASFQLKPPSVLGFIKVDDQVLVEVEVLLRQQ